MNGKIKLYHYSDKKFDSIEPKFFGDNFHTLGDIKSSRIKRSFFYIDKNIPEYRFENCKYQYIAEVLANKIYDLRKDKQNLKRKYQGNIEGLLAYIKEGKYHGAIYNCGYDIAILFKNIKPKKVVRLTTERKG